LTDRDRLADLSRRRIRSGVRTVAQAMYIGVASPTLRTCLCFHRRPKRWLAKVGPRTEGSSSFSDRPDAGHDDSSASERNHQASLPHAGPAEHPGAGAAATLAVRGCGGRGHLAAQARPDLPQQYARRLRGTGTSATDPFPGSHSRSSECLCEHWRMAGPWITSVVARA
jgi:hypothetical protein